MAIVVCGLASLLAGQQKPAKDPLAFRFNELKLAGLRPGRDKLSRAKKLYEGPWLKTVPNDPNVLLIRGDCTGALLRIEAEKSGIIEQIILTQTEDAERASLSSALPHCADVKAQMSVWATGRGIGLNSKAAELHAAYGDPEIKSPSTRDGQPLELLHYAFDWAGPDVPQVLEVLCTREKEGQPGRVLEITLAAPSL